MIVLNCSKCGKLLDKPLEPLELEKGVYETMYCDDCWADFMEFCRTRQ